MDEERKRKSEGSYSNLNKLITVCHGWLNRDMDLLFGVSAFKGVGKSNFTLDFLKRWIETVHGRNIIPHIDLEKYIAYDNDEVYTKPRTLEPYSCLVCDEAVRFAMAEDWATLESKELKRLFAQIRTKHLVVFFNIPDFWWLDRKYRESMTTMRINIVSRGTAVMYFPDLREGIDDRWHKKYFRDKVKPYNYFTATDTVMKSLRKHPCYYDEFKFPKCPKSIYEQYLKIRNLKVFEYEKDTNRGVPTLLSKAMVYNLHMKDPKLWTYQRISKELTAHPATGRALFTPDGLRKQFVEMERLKNRYESDVKIN